jgi:hypothetical protein
MREEENQKENQKGNILFGLKVENNDISIGARSN